MFKSARAAAVDMEMLYAYQRGHVSLPNYIKWVESFPPLCGVRYPLHSMEYSEDIAMHAAQAIYQASLFIERTSDPKA